MKRAVLLTTAEDLAAALRLPAGSLVVDLRPTGRPGEVELLVLGDGIRDDWETPAGERPGRTRYAALLHPPIEP